MHAHDKNIEFKRTRLQGVEQHLFAYEMLASVKVVITRVKSQMTKKGHYGYIGLTDSLLPGEVIELGEQRRLYIIVKVHKLHPKDGIIHKIRRYDENNLTSTDIGIAKVGDKVLIKNRRPHSKTVEQFFKFENK